MAGGRSALAWLRAEGVGYRVDPRRIVVWGESAGATIGSLAALEPDSGIAGVIDWLLRVASFGDALVIVGGDDATVVEGSLAASS